MKKIFAFTMAVVAMASVMTSCNNDEADFIEQKAPVAAQQEEEVIDPYTIEFAILDKMEGDVDATFIVETESGDFEVDPKTATEVAPSKMFKMTLEHAGYGNLLAKGSIKIYRLNLPANVSGQVNAHVNLSAAEGFENYETHNVMAFIFANGCQHGNAVLGIMTEAIDMAFNGVTKNSSASYNIR